MRHNSALQKCKRLINIIGCKFVENYSTRQLNFTRKKDFGWTQKKCNKISTIEQSALRDEGLLMFIGA